MSVYVYDQVQVLRVLDGDSVWLRVAKPFDFGFHVKGEHSFEDNFRLRGIDAPDVRASDPESAVRREAAKVHLSQLLSGGVVRAETFKKEKFGRWMVELTVLIDGVEVSVNQRMLEDGHAVAYSGGKR